MEGDTPWLLARLFRNTLHDTIVTGPLHSCVAAVSSWCLRFAVACGYV